MSSHKDQIKVDNEQKKKKKQRRSAGGEHDDIDQTSETLAPQKRKKTTKKALSQSVDETRFASEGNKLCDTQVLCGRRL